MSVQVLIILSFIFVVGMIMGFFSRPKRMLIAATVLTVILAALAFFSTDKGSEDRGFFPLSTPLWCLIWVVNLLGGGVGNFLKSRIYGKNDNDIDATW